LVRHGFHILIVLDGRRRTGVRGGAGAAGDSRGFTALFRFGLISIFLTSFLGKAAVERSLRSPVGAWWRDVALGDACVRKMLARVTRCGFVD
jgi:hypothetical protein